MPTNPKHLPALDGLRGLAVLLVIFFHLKLLNIGWVGVQIFFVLSGFLITRLLIADRDEYSLSQNLKLFYVRRALRIFPAYYAYLLVLLVASYAISSMQSTRNLLPSSAIYMQNIATLFGYNEGMSEAARYSTLHLWSLSVEEHFYFFWPLLILAINPRNYLMLIVSLLVLTPAFRWAAMTHWADWFPAAPSVAEVNYFFTGAQLDAFATGALLNLLLPRLSRSGRYGSPWLLVLAVIAYCLLSNAGLVIHQLSVWMNPQTADFDWSAERYYKDVWRYTLVNLLSVQLVVLALSHQRLGSFFNLGFMRWTGKISYGMYLVHAPLVYLAFAVEGYLKGLTGSSVIATTVAVAGCLVLIYFISDLSYRHYESRFLKLKPRHPAPERPTRIVPEGALPA